MGFSYGGKDGIMKRLIEQVRIRVFDRRLEAVSYEESVGRFHAGMAISISYFPL